jgi:2-C-methyl-D-erythritol 2,4-cyclodiphosphate synthase
VVSCEAPKLLPYREAIRASLATVLGVPATAVFVKGKTNEGLGPLGEGLAVEALAVCLLESCGEKTKKRMEDGDEDKS